MKIATSIDMTGNQIIALRAENLASLPAAGSKGRFVYRSADDTLHFDNGTAWVQLGAAGAVDWAAITGKPTEFPPSAHTHVLADITGLVAALAAKSDTGHGHVAANISDFTSAVNTAIAAYFDAATADETRDTLNELIALITSNEGAIATLQSKADIYAVNAPSLTGTSATITHNLNTKDIVVKIYEIASDQEVLCDVTRTSVNVVTLNFGSVQTADTLRVVVMG